MGAGASTSFPDGQSPEKAGEFEEKYTALKASRPDAATWELLQETVLGATAGESVAEALAAQAFDLDAARARGSASSLEEGGVGPAWQVLSRV